MSSEHWSLAVESAVEVAGGQKIGVILIFGGLVCYEACFLES